MENKPKTIQPIYCKECKYYRDYSGCKKVCSMWFNTAVNDDGYCYKAERKDKDGK